MSSSFLLMDFIILILRNLLLSHNLWFPPYPLHLEPNTSKNQLAVTWTPNKSKHQTSCFAHLIVLKTSGSFHLKISFTIPSGSHPLLLHPLIQDPGPLALTLSQLRTSFTPAIHTIFVSSISMVINILPDSAWSKNWLTWLVLSSSLLQAQKIRTE